MMEAQLVALDAEQLQALLGVLETVASLLSQTVYALYVLTGVVLSYALVELFFGFWRG